MVICSRNGYSSSGDYRVSGDESDILDIVEDGKIVGEITSKQLRDYLKRCKKAGKKPKYTNIRSYCIIEDPNRVVKRLEYVFGVYKNCEAFTRESDFAVVKRSAVNGKYHFSFDLPNGFVIGVHAFAVNDIGVNFSSVEFEVFGVRETFGLGDDFTLVIGVYSYSVNSIDGAIYVKSSHDGRESETKLGDFTLTHSGTLYKGENINVVYDSARFAKELIRRD